MPNQLTVTTLTNVSAETFFPNPIDTEALKPIFEFILFLHCELQFIFFPGKVRVCSKINSDFQESRRPHGR